MTSARTVDTSMSADAFIAWYAEQPSGVRFELLDGHRFAMSSEQAVHARVKRRIANLFDRAIIKEGLPCEVFGDGMAVRIDDDNVFEPDALVVCGEALPDQAIIVESPVIVVEVASPSTQRIDATVKLSRYFRNPGIVHFLIAIPTTKSVVHHRRVEANKIDTTSYDMGRVILDPPGIELNVAELFQPTT